MGDGPAGDAAPAASGQGALLITAGEGCGAAAAGDKTLNKRLRFNSNPCMNLKQLFKGRVPMDLKLDISTVAVAADTSVAQIQGWIARGHFRPRHSTVPGAARRFDEHDAIRLALMSYAVNYCGLSFGVAAAIADMFREQVSFLVDLRHYEKDQFAIVFLDAPFDNFTNWDATTRPLTFGVTWDGVMSALSQRDPTGATIINLSTVAKEAFTRLYEALGRE